MNECSFKLLHGQVDVHTTHQGLFFKELMELVVNVSVATLRLATAPTFLIPMLELLGLTLSSGLSRVRMLFRTERL